MFSTIYYFFARYVNASERRVGRFFARVNERQLRSYTEKKLLELVQADVAAINLWTEHRYKGYHYLNKTARRRLYANLEAIYADFDEFMGTYHSDIQRTLNSIAALGVDTMKLRTMPEQLHYMVGIAQYFNPEKGRYIYRPSSSFGRLLHDPSKETLEGDCNQIVTLYIALYARKYHVSDLQLTLLPNHVALRLAGVDIEATTGKFAHYHEKGQKQAPIHEIVSINLLDTTDTHFAKSLVGAEVFLEAARLAYLVSSSRSLVEKNLGIAYRNAVHALLDKHHYKQALTYALESGQYELIEASAQGGAVYALNDGHFRDARTFAAKSSMRKAELLRAIDEHEAVHYFNTKHYEAALKIYKRLGMTAAARQCYEALYVQAQSQLGNPRTAQEQKGNARTIRRMERYARESGNSKLVEHVHSLTKYL